MKDCAHEFRVCFHCDQAGHMEANFPLLTTKIV